MFGVWSDSQRIRNYFDPKSGFQTVELFQLRVLKLTTFNLNILSNLEPYSSSINMKVVEDRLSYKVHVESLAWNPKDRGEKGSETRGLDWYLMFQLSFCFWLSIKSIFLSKIELNFDFCQNQTCRSKQELQLLYLKFCPKLNRSVNTSFWILWNVWLDSEIQFYLYLTVSI